MGRLAALFGPFCECHVSYLGSVEEPGSFGAGNDFERHAVGDAGDEVADVAGSREFGKSCAVCELAGLFR